MKQEDKGVAIINRRPTHLLKGLVLVIAAIVVIGGLGVFLWHKANPPVDCAALIKKTDTLYKEKQYSKVVSTLSPDYDTCVLNSKSTKDQVEKSAVQRKINSVVYGSKLAMAEYANNDKAQAKKYANKVIEINKTLSPAERSKVPNQTSILLQMYTVSFGLSFPAAGLVK